jgi:Fe-S-cluster containining protein
MSAPENLIRELPRIRRYSRHNEAEDMRFRAFVKTRLPLSNAELDAVVRETTDAVWQELDCLTCGNCCRTLQIVVDNADIRRLSTRLGLTSKQFAARYVSVAEDKAQHFTSTPCPFLGQDNRCSVYEDRPQACRDFPYLHTDGFRQRMLVMIENGALCPIVFNVYQRLKQRLWKRR